MISILHTHIGKRLSSQEWERRLSEMPGLLQARIGRYRRWEDRQAGLFGKQLLAEGLRRSGYAPAQLEKLVWDASGRPFLGCGIDFNISHSGDYVVCALCGEARVGIDIEQIRPIDLSDFKMQLTPEQWQTVVASENCLEAFFHLWTQKEAVIKADGRGLSIPLDKIISEGGNVFLTGRVWRVREVRVADGYCCHLATSGEISEGDIEKIFFQFDIV
jgi:4'-phosphopantetheinyl transferase